VCAHAVRVALKSVSGVNDVEVSLNRGNAVVSMKPGNTASFSQLQRAITKNGFVINETKVELTGEIMRSNAQLLLKVVGTSDSYPLSFANPDVQKVVDAAAGKRVRLRGTLPPAKSEKLPDVVMVTALLAHEDER
jgi:copper chaperone CopZ